MGRIWGIWESYYNTPKAILYLLKVDYSVRKSHIASTQKGCDLDWDPFGALYASFRTQGGQYIDPKILYSCYGDPQKISLIV